MKPLSVVFIIFVLWMFVDAQRLNQTYELKPTPKTVAWGYYDAGTPPVLRIKSGDTVEVQTLITSSPVRLEGAGVKPADVEQSLRDIYKEVTNKGPGGHILTGPIFVEGAEPGDVLEVRIKSIKLAIPYAYNAFGPGRGFLPEDFPYPKMRIIPLDEKRMVAYSVTASRFPCIHSLAASVWRRPTFRGASQARRRGFTPAISITRNWSRAPRSSFPFMRRVPCFSQAMAMPVRATAKWTSRQWRLRSSARFN